MACLFGAALSGDLLLATGGLVAVHALTVWQRDPVDRPQPGATLLGAVLSLSGACVVARAVGGSTWEALAGASGSALAGAGAVGWVAGLACLRVAPCPAPRDSLRAGVAAACRDGAAPLLLVAVLTRLGPALGQGDVAQHTLLWGSLVVALLCAVGALRASGPSQAATHVTTAVCALVVLCLVGGAASAGVLLGLVAAPALACLQLALTEASGGLVALAPSGLEGSRRRQPGGALGVLLAVAVLAGLPPLGGHRAWASAVGAWLDAGAWVPLLGLGAVATALSWGLGRLALESWRSGARLDPSSSPVRLRRAAPLLTLGVLASLLAAWLVPGLAAWRPDALASRLLAQAPSPESVGWLATPTGVAATPWALIAAALPTLCGFALAAWGPVWETATRPARASRLGQLWLGLGTAAAQVDRRVLGAGASLAARAQRWWERPDPLPARRDDAPGRFGYQGAAYRDAALAGAFVLIAILVGVLLA
jgi:hypothetical protein